MYGQIDGEDGQPGYFTRGFSAKVVLENSGQTLRFVYDDTSYGTKGTDWFSVAEAEAHSSYDQPPWYICRNSVTQVIFDSSFSAYRPKHCGCWFQDFAALAAVKGMNNLDTFLATSLSYMFAGCSSRQRRSSRFDASALLSCCLRHKFLVQFAQLVVVGTKTMEVLVVAITKN